MGRSIVKLGGKYLEWSSIVDAPVTYGMTLDEFKEYYREEYGREGMLGLEDRISRVEAKGTSSIMDESAEDTVWLNRAGAGETRLSVAQIIDHYVNYPEELTDEELNARPLPVGKSLDEDE